MTQELKDAIVTIAEYNDPLAIIIYVESEFHTSADCLLPVWRKVNEECIQKAGWLLKDLADAYYLIAYGNLPAACIKLAEIIKQLKNG